MTAPPIELDSVSFAYDGSGGKRVVDGISLDVREGELLGILGANGAGKSTLLRLMSALAMPSAGRVRIAGRDTGTMSRGESARIVAVVPQREPSIFGFSARDVVAMGRAPHTGLLGTLSANDHAVVDAALARCDATEFAARPMSELSGGEQKRVLIARALAQGATLLLLDEPVAFLDVKHQLAVCELLAHGVRAREFTAIAVLHDLNLAARFCDRLMLMRDGRCLAIGPVDEVMTEARLREAFDVDVFIGKNTADNTRFFIPTRAR